MVVALLVLFLIAFFIFWCILEIAMIIEYSLPPSDSDMLEYLQKRGKDYAVIRKNWSECFYMEGNTYRTKTVWKARWSILFPYYIADVGVLPVWYKSTKQLDVIFKNLKSKSNYHNNKRKELGLD
jgi:hypothetical protein